MRADQRVNQVRPGADIQHGRLLRNNAITVFSQKIGKVMKVIRAARNGWTEKAFRNIPVRHTVVMCEQRFVQHFNRLGVSKVDRRFTRGGLDNIVL